RESPPIVKNVLKIFTLVIVLLLVLKKGSGGCQPAVSPTGSRRGMINAASISTNRNLFALRLVHSLHCIYAKSQNHTPRHFSPHSRVGSGQRRMGWPFQRQRPHWLDTKNRQRHVLRGRRLHRWPNARPRRRHEQLSLHHEELR